MNIVVQKYGGTSVADKDKLDEICDNIISCKNANNAVIVVVSAQGNSTDKLIKKAYEYCKKPNKRDLDFLLSTGEMQTVALLSMMIHDRGYTSIGLTGEQAGILSDSTYGNAKILSIYEENILNYLKEDKIVIITGFQGVDKLGNITTLGRGGSDLTAVAIASQVKAKKCEIYTDVDGLFTADPRVISKAKLIKKVSYNEILEAASLGAKVMHNRAVNVGKKFKMPITIKKIDSKKKGSMIQEGSTIKKKKEKKDTFETNEVKFITKKENITRISIVGDMMMSNQDISLTVFDLSKELEVPIEMISFSEVSLNIAVDSNKAIEFMKALHEKLVE